MATACFPMNPTYEGYMHFNDFNSTSKEFYFILNNTFLFGIKSKATKKVSIALSMEGATISNSSHHDSSQFLITSKNKKWCFKAPKLSQAKQWIFVLRQASTLKLRDIYKFCHSIANDSNCAASIIAAQHRENKTNVIIKAINKKKTNKKVAGKQIPFLKSLAKFQRIIELNDIFETKKSLHLILSLSPSDCNSETIASHIIHKIAMQKEYEMDHVLLGIIAYIAICGYTPWVNNDAAVEFIKKDWENVSNTMLILTRDLLRGYPYCKHKRDEIMKYTSSEWIFWRGCDNFNTLKENLHLLFYGFVREINNDLLYERIPIDIVGSCVLYTYDEKKLQVMEGKVVMEEKELKFCNRWGYFFGREFERRLWRVRVKSTNNFYRETMKSLYIRINAVNVIDTMINATNGDTISVLFEEGYLGQDDVLKIGLNGKLCEEQTFILAKNAPFRERYRPVF